MAWATTGERSSFWSVVTVEVLSGSASVIAAEAFPACRVVLSIAIATRYGGTPRPAMTWQEQYQQEGSAAELFQRYVVPRITSLWAKDLVDRACVRVGESVLDVACGTGVVTRLAAQQSGNGRVVGLDLNSDMLRVARGVAQVDKSQVQMAERMVRDRRQGFGQLRFGRREGRHGTGDKEICALGRVRARRSNERVDIAGIGGERAIEKALRLRQVVAGYTLVEPCQTLKIEVH